MECRICFEEGGKENLCDCRGTQGTMHIQCLKNWIRVKNSMTCSVCNALFRLPTQKILFPNAWWILGSPAIFPMMFLSVLMVTNFGPDAYEIYCQFLQIASFLAYSYAYYPILCEYGSLQYFKHWFLTPYFKYRQQHFIPLLTITAIITVLFHSQFICVLWPFQTLWNIHICVLIARGDVIQIL